MVVAELRKAGFQRRGAEFAEKTERLEEEGVKDGARGEAGLFERAAGLWEISRSGCIAADFITGPKMAD